MAASGIAEHNEARRREIVYLRKAFLQRGMQDPILKAIKVNQNKVELAAAGKDWQPSGKSNSYSREVQQHQCKHCKGRLPGQKHDAATVDKERRMAHYKQIQTEYSAKLPNRYTSNDYVSQW